jgi:hypothetical protein
VNRAYSNKTLTKRQQNRNLLISKKRYNVERVFGTLKKCYDLARSSYIGTSRVQGELLLSSLAYNLKRGFFYGLHRRCALINPEKGSMDAERELKMLFSGLSDKKSDKIDVFLLSLLRKRKIL